MSKILLAGEQVTSVSISVKGFDFFVGNAFVEDGQAMVRALKATGHDVCWMRTCNVPAEFPERKEDLGGYDVVILSDVGSNSLLLHPELLSKSVRHPNRLRLLRDFVGGGGGLLMIGGWMSFAGIDGRGRYHGTALEDALPVTCQPCDDRVEAPEGVAPAVVQPDHPVLTGLPKDWPFFLGYNRLLPRPQASVLLKVDDDPLLTVWAFGKGRSAAFASDCAPHWGPPEFLNWSGYKMLWNNLVNWLAGK